MSGLGFSRKDFSLRPLTEGDSAAILRWRNEESIRACMYNNRVIGREEHQEWLHCELQNPDARHLIFLYRGKPSGYVAVSLIERRHQRCCWAFNLSDERDGLPKGIGAVMEYLALEYIFDELGIRKLCCEVLSFNERVIKLHKRFGFSEEGLLRQHVQRDDGLFDVVVLALFADHWHACRDQIAQGLFGGG